jgi:hypothetical protein
MEESCLLSISNPRHTSNSFFPAREAGSLKGFPIALNSLPITHKFLVNFQEFC